MAGRRNPSFLKRQKEQKRVEKANAKRTARQARRAQRAAEASESDAPGEDLLERADQESTPDPGREE